MIFFPVWEVFEIICKLVKETQKVINTSKQDDDSRLKWHVPLTNREHAQVVMTYIDFYTSKSSGLKGAGSGKQLIKKCDDLGLNFDKIVNLMLNSLTTALLPIDLSIYAMTVFIFEGQKSLIRFIYSSLKNSKTQFLQVESKRDLIRTLRENLRLLSQDALSSEAFNLSLKTQGYGSNLNFN